MRCLFVASLVALALGACESLTSTASSSVETTAAEAPTLARYATYTHETAATAPSGYVRGALAPEVLAEMREDVDAELQGRGYRLAPDAELVVRISTGVRAVEDQPTGASAAAGVPVTEDTEGALVIDIFERASGEQLFHGFAKDIVRGKAPNDDQIARAVSKILEPVPDSRR